MTGRRKLEQLTASWYAFTLFSGVVQLFANGIGLFSLVVAAVSTGLCLVIAHIIGRALIGKSGLTRGLMIGLSGLGLFFGALGVLHLVGDFFGTWRFALLGSAVMTLAGMGMNVLTLSVLLDDSVRRYMR